MRAVLATFLLIAFSGVALASNYTEKDVIGHWHRGGFGYFTQLVLSPNHTYKAEWSGDQIDPDTIRPEAYGQARGKWNLQGDLLVLIPTRETKETKGDLRSMKLVR